MLRFNSVMYYLLFYWCGVDLFGLLFEDKGCIMIYFLLLFLVICLGVI